MSYEIFKQNMLSFMRNQASISDQQQFAKKLVEEYDALIKRGYDIENGITVQEGNTELMFQVLNGVLSTAFQQSSGEHAIITNMGKAFQSYWIPTIGVARQLEQIEDIAAEGDDLESVLELAETTSAQIFNDEPDENPNADGTFSGIQLRERLKQIQDGLKKNEPKTPVARGKGINEVLPYEKQPTIPVRCPTNEELYLKNGEINYELQLSPSIKLKHLSSKAGSGHLLQDMRTTNERFKERGYRIRLPEIVCNLKSLAVNIVEPLLLAYPGFMNPVEGKGFVKINSAFRSYSTAGGASQHMLGEAIDVQWLTGANFKSSNYSTEKYMEIANWCLQNLPVDQLIYEHTETYGRVWLHISHRRDGQQRDDNAWTMYGGKYETGFYNKYPSS